MTKPTGRPPGRPKGSATKRVNLTPSEMAAVAAKVERAIEQPFTGDAHAFLMAVYKDPAHSVDLRLDAAKAAVRYEKPALASVESRSEVRHVVRRTPMTERDWAIERAGQDAHDLGAATGAADRPH